ncbi:hypothetical protein [Desulfosporosinus meridiei]|uniref:hypothetical protein n=1 Tax=Desulfosporosinus meridiei TaxID=79209 RepID=UPI0011D2C042|nr:hypothetical protein [Desulfosporosinus meridiei]
MRQPLGGSRCEPGRNCPFSIGARFIENSTKVFTKQNVPLVSGRRGWGTAGVKVVKYGESKGTMSVHTSANVPLVFVVQKKLMMNILGLN